MKSFNKQVIAKLGLLDVEKNPLNEIGIERLKMSK